MTAGLLAVTQDNVPSIKSLVGAHARPEPVTPLWLALRGCRSVPIHREIRRSSTRLREVAVITHRRHAAFTPTALYHTAQLDYVR